MSECHHEADKAAGQISYQHVLSKTVIHIMKKKCPSCDKMMKEVRLAMISHAETQRSTIKNPVRLYPKEIYESNYKRTYDEYRFVCMNCKKEWVYNSLFHEMSEVPHDSQMVYNREHDMLIERV